MPLLSGLFGGNSAELPPGADTAMVASDSNAAPVARPTVPSAPGAWRELAKNIESDSLMRPARGTAKRDPFQTNKIDVEQRAKEMLTSAQPPLTPEQLGIVLSSTIIGGQRRVARIAGTSYRIGDHILAGKDGQELDFTITKIEPRSVMLVRDGQRYEITLKRQQRSASSAAAATAADRDTSDLTNMLDPQTMDELIAPAAGLLGN